MKHKAFDQYLEKRFNIIRSILASKSAEYSTESDKLHNFKRAGDMLQTIPEKALIGMWTKHIISILDIVDKLENENKKIGLNFLVNPSGIDISQKLIMEKIGDAINYLLLLEALLLERFND